jgi:hypothetical protein
VRATQHDELMREAGFETDYYVELERRRERRRQTLRRDILLALSAVAFVGALAGFGGFVGWIAITGTRAHFPRALLAAAALAGPVGATAGWLAGRITRDEEVEDRRRRSLSSRILVPPVVRPLLGRVRERVERRREIEA